MKVTQKTQPAQRVQQKHPAACPVSGTGEQK